MSTQSTSHPALHGLPLVALLAVSGAQAAQPTQPTFSIDVAADCNRYIEDTSQPSMGAYFIQEGVIYRPGTLAARCPHGNGCGLNPDGTPQFPEAVIGKWRCWGSFVGTTAAAAAGGPPSYSTQVYEFASAAAGGEIFEPGDHALISHGPEWVDLEVPFERAIAGGYGHFKNADGEVAQTRIGFNQTQCENYTFDFKLRTQTRSWR
jgi:hypothetical protein